MILSSQKLPELWDYFLIYVSGALEFNPDCKDIDLGLFPLRMNPTIKTRYVTQRQDRGAEKCSAWLGSRLSADSKQC